MIPWARVYAWTKERYRDHLTERLGGTQICPWCRQCAQFGDGQHYVKWDRDPFIDVLHCGVCGGLSLWRWEMGMLYIGPLSPPEPAFPPVPWYEIGAAELRLDNDPSPKGGEHDG